MTIGEKIKYFRKKRKYSQGVLAELSGIHMITIAKYEANKMQPQPAQIMRLCEALSVSYFALLEPEYNWNVNNSGDTLGLIMHCLKHNLMFLYGERDDDGKILAKTAYIQFHPAFMGQFAASVPGWELKHKSLYWHVGLRNDEFRANDLNFRLRNEAELDWLLRWDQARQKYKIAVDHAGDDCSESTIEILEALNEAMYSIELDLFLNYSKL